MKEKDMERAGKIVLLSAVILVLIGIVLIAVGQYTNSIGLISDGIDSIGDAGVSFIVWFGLRVSKRAPDHRFHFGYYRVENLAAMGVAMLMVVISAAIFYNAYQRLINPEELHLPLLGVLVLLGAGFTSMGLAIAKNRIAKKSNLLSLKADAKNSIKDFSASFIVLGGVLLSVLGFPWGDPLGAIVVGIFILYVAVTTIKESSLILLDAFKSTELVEDIAGIVGKNRKLELRDIKLRQSGPFITGKIVVGVKPGMSIREFHKIKEKIERDIMEEFEGVKEVAIVPEPRERVK